MKSNFVTSGIDTYLDVLQRAGKDIDLVSRQALAEVGVILQEAMTSRAEGSLKELIKIKTPSGEGHYNYLAVGVLHDLSYTSKEEMVKALSVEFGHINANGTFTPAHPYIRPGISSVRARCNNLIKERLKAAGLVD
jgi:hypothetical protein